MSEKGKFQRNPAYFIKQRLTHLNTIVAAHNKSVTQIDTIVDSLNVQIGDKEAPELRALVTEYVNVRAELQFDLRELEARRGV